MEGKLFTYTSAWSRAYSCLCGGTGRFKPLPQEEKPLARYYLDKFGGHNQLKQCCILRQCNSYNTSSSVGKQTPPTHSEVQDTASHSH